MTVALPPSAGYSGQAVFAVAAVPANLRLAISYANRPPTGVSALSAIRKIASAQLAAQDTASTDVVYGCFATNEVLDINGTPQFSFTLPPGFATNSVVYDLAIERGGTWTTGYGGPGTINATTTAATVTIAGRFGFTIPANGSVCVALYAGSTTAPTPVPATPAPDAVPSSHPSTTPTSTPTPTPTPTPTSTPTSTPTPPQLTISPAAINLLGLGASFAQSVSVNETGYTGAFTISATGCANIATVSPSTGGTAVGGIAGTGAAGSTGSTGNGPTLPLTVTGLAPGRCTATVTDTNGKTASLPITVTV